MYTEHLQEEENFKREKRKEKKKKRSESVKAFGHIPN